jgi:hypothetical protein
MNAKVFGVGVGLFLILMSQLVVIYREVLNSIGKSTQN